MRINCGERGEYRVNTVWNGGLYRGGAHLCLQDRLGGLLYSADKGVLVVIGE